MASANDVQLAPLDFGARDCATKPTGSADHAAAARTGAGPDARAVRIPPPAGDDVPKRLGHRQAPLLSPVYGGRSGAGTEALWGKIVDARRAMTLPDANGADGTLSVTEKGLPSKG